MNDTTLHTDDYVCLKTTMKYQVMAVSIVSVVQALVCWIPPKEDMGRVILASVVFRHGAKTPVGTYPTDPYRDDTVYWPRGFGQLTEIGESQLFFIGVDLRRRYHHLLPLTYNTNDTYARCADIDRLLMSATCALTGLYPKTEKNLSPLPFQAIPVHTVDINSDKLLQASRSCAKYATLLSLVGETPEYQCMRNNTAQIREEVARYTGSDTFDPWIYEILQDQDFYDYPLPNWVEKYYQSPLREIFLFEFPIKFSSTREMQRLYIGPLLHEIIVNMKAKASCTLDPDRSLYIYSSQGFVVSSFLRTLRVSGGMIVPYGSTIFIELREKWGRYYVTVLYRHGTTSDTCLLQIPGCECLCPLYRFIELTKNVMPYGDHDECTDEVEEGHQFYFDITDDVIPPEWKHCFRK